MWAWTLVLRVLRGLARRAEARKRRQRCLAVTAARDRCPASHVGPSNKKTPELSGLT
jgi:hypothetical protein